MGSLSAVLIFLVVAFAFLLLLVVGTFIVVGAVRLSKKKSSILAPISSETVDGLTPQEEAIIKSIFATQAQEKLEAEVKAKMAKAAAPKA